MDETGLGLRSAERQLDAPPLTVTVISARTSSSPRPFPAPRGRWEGQVGEGSRMPDLLTGGDCHCHHVGQPGNQRPEDR